jgi:hypothetical protein
MVDDVGEAVAVSSEKIERMNVIGEAHLVESVEAALSRGIMHALGDRNRSGVSRGRRGSDHGSGDARRDGRRKHGRCRGRASVGTDRDGREGSEHGDIDRDRGTESGVSMNELELAKDMTGLRGKVEVDGDVHDLGG